MDILEQMCELDGEPTVVDRVQEAQPVEDAVQETQPVSKRLRARLPTTK